MFRFISLSLACLLTTGYAAANFVVKPYVQIGPYANDGVIRLVVMWHAEEGSGNFEVRYNGKVATQTSRKIAVGNIAPHLVYEALLKDLEPGGLVHYQVLENGKVVFESDAKTPKKNASDPLRFSLFGDCGRGRAVQRDIAKQVLKTDPDFCVLTGDLVYVKGKVSEYRSNFYPYYNDQVPLMPRVPFIVVPGNHDTAYIDMSNNSDGQAYWYYWSQPRNGPVGFGPKFKGNPESTEAFAKSTGGSYPNGDNYSFDYGNTHWVMLDSNPYNNFKAASFRNWLETDLKSSSAKWKFVAFHHPPFHSSNAHQDDRFMRSVTDIFTKQNVDIVFSGHVHNYQRSYPMTVGNGFISNVNAEDWRLDLQFDGRQNTKPNGTIYIVTGAGGAELYDKDIEYKPEIWKPYTNRYISRFSFSDISIVGGTLTFKQVGPNGAELDGFTIKK